jgi:hypothetical protein
MWISLVFSCLAIAISVLLLLPYLREWLFPLRAFGANLLRADNRLDEPDADRNLYRVTSETYRRVPRWSKEGRR